MFSSLFYFTITVLLFQHVAAATNWKSSHHHAKNPPNEEVDSSNCFFDGQRTCERCSAMALCVKTESGFSAYREKCQTDQICNIASNQVDAECTANPANDEPGAECFCNTGLPEPRTEPDPYTTHAYIYCKGGDSLSRDCEPSTYIYTASLDGCSPPPPTCTGIGIFPFPDDCHFYYTCLGVGQDGIVSECPYDDYYDVNYGRCEDFPYYPYMECTDEAGDPITGTVPHSYFTCTHYGVCDDGELVSEETCADCTIYSQEASMCIPDDGSCISVTYCYDD